MQRINHTRPPFTTPTSPAMGTNTAIPADHKWRALNPEVIVYRFMGSMMETLPCCQMTS